MRRLQSYILIVFIGLSTAATSAEIVTIAGSGRDEFSGDGGPALEAGLGQPFGLELGPDGALYFCEYSNHVVRRLDLKSNVVSTVAGTGRNPENPALLTNQELAAFHICAAQNLRIEQERIPQAAVNDAVRNR